MCYSSFATKLRVATVQYEKREYRPTVHTTQRYSRRRSFPTMIKSRKNDGVYRYVETATATRTTTASAAPPEITRIPNPEEEPANVSYEEPVATGVSTRVEEGYARISRTITAKCFSRCQTDRLDIEVETIDDEKIQRIGRKKCMKYQEGVVKVMSNIGC